MYYAAYGSNINLFQMKYRCPNSKVIGVGFASGWKLYFNYHADVEYTGKSEDIVPILIWDIADEDWKRLDMYEGFPKYYIKKHMDVESVLNNKAIKYDCIVYVMSSENADSYQIPAKDYLKIIIDGYCDNNIDCKYLEEALKYTAQCIGEYYLE